MVVNKAKMQSRKISEKTNSNLGIEKSYEDFSPILDGYSDLLDHLSPDDPNSEIDKVVKFILHKNILVRHVNILLSNLSSTKSVDFYESIQEMKNLKVGRFTRGKFGEDVFLLKRWDQLIHEVPIYNPLKLLSELSCIDHKEKSVLKKRKGLKRNVIGCYLGQDLDAIRHAADIFHHACRLISTPIQGKFSKEEDSVILSEVEKTGASLKTWKKIGYLLKRTNLFSISRRHRLLTTEKTSVVGRWTLPEVEILFETFFGGQKNDSVDLIKSLRYKDFDLVADKLNRPKNNVWDHWSKSLKPILLSHHSGTLHKLWCLEFYKYLVEKKVTGRQNINFSEAVQLFPEQNSESLHQALRIFSRKEENEEQPLYQVIQKYLPTFKDPQERERIKNFREEIVRIYDEVRKRG